MEYRAAIDFFFRQLHRVGIIWQYVYETRLAPWLAIWLWVLFWPGYKVLKHKNIRLVVNMGEGTGQVLPELDNFVRRSTDRELAQNNTYIWIRKRNDFSKACVPFYRPYFTKAYMSTVLYNLVLPMQLRWRNITVDAGMSGLRWQIPVSGRYKPAPPWQTYLEALPKADAVRLWREYYARRARKPQWYPLRKAAGDKLEPDQTLLDFLGNRTRPLALVHIKETVMNATARPTDPRTYGPALKHLQKMGYTLVFVGRETMPKVFQDLHVKNYAESRLASFKHDLQLFRLASLAITGGSGIAWIADCLGTPVVYLNSWHLFMPPFQKYCVYVPTLLKDATGNFLTFPEQFVQCMATPTERGDVFQSASYTPHNASAEEIEAALHELLALMKNYQERSELQQQYATLGSEGWLEYAEARVSQQFVETHQKLLGMTKKPRHLQ